MPERSLNTLNCLCKIMLVNNIFFLFIEEYLLLFVFFLVQLFLPTAKEIKINDKYNNIKITI